MYFPGEDPPVSPTFSGENDIEAMEQLAAMGMEEGLTQAVDQIDEILAETG